MKWMKLKLLAWSIRDRTGAWLKEAARRLAARSGRAAVGAARSIVPRATQAARKLRPGLPKPVRYIVELFPYEPRPAIALGIYAFLFVLTMGYAAITAIAYKTGVASTVGLFFIFGVIGLGWPGIITVPIAWPRLWMVVRDITPWGYVDSWASPTLRGKYLHNPRFYDPKARMLVKVNTLLWDQEQFDWALEEYGPEYASGEIPMDYERQVRRMTPVDVANAANAERTTETARRKKQEWEKPVALGLMVLLIVVSLFFMLALLSTPATGVEVAVG